MENNKRCYIFFPSSFLGVKKNGRGSSRRACKYSRFDNRIFAIFRFFVWASFWFCACFCRPALAEFDQSDSDRLKWIQEDINEMEMNSDTLVDFMSHNIIDNVAYLYVISKGLGYDTYSGTLKGDMTKILNYMGYGSGGTLAGALTSLVNQTNQIKTNLGGDNYNTIADRLDALINYLENTPSMPTDIATETTLSAFKAQNHTDITAFQSKYEELSNQFLTSWGFSGGSGNSFKDYFLGGSQIYVNNNQVNSAVFSPFPNSDKNWNQVGIPAVRAFSSTGSFFKDLSLVLAWRERQSGYTTLENMKKQAWNDWYAHTNTVARLDMIFDSLNSTPDVRVDGTDDIGTIAENQLDITFDKATGDSAETIDLQPAFTNDVAELTAPAESVTNKLANLITYSKLSNRYKTPNIDDTNYRDYEITQDIPDYNLQYGSRPQMSFKFTSTARNLFRGFLSRERMSTLRSIFLKLWAFLAIYCNFLIFKIFGKMGGNE